MGMSLYAWIEVPLRYLSEHTPQEVWDEITWEFQVTLPMLYDDNDLPGDTECISEDIIRFVGYIGNSAEFDLAALLVKHGIPFDRWHEDNGGDFMAHQRHFRPAIVCAPAIDVDKPVTNDGSNFVTTYDLRAILNSETLDDAARIEAIRELVNEADPQVSLLEDWGGEEDYVWGNENESVEETQQ